MSASLVGSEMCIRDRPISGGGAIGATREWGLRPGVMARLLGKGTSSGEPVSYTHLTLPTICSV
eukprot:11799095-Alexandrium_andersonii.AAC.1